MPNKIRDLKGQRFGSLTALEQAKRVKKSNGNTDIYWLCQCDCKGTKEIRADHLIHGHIKSCGCLTQALLKLHLETSCFYCHKQLTLATSNINCLLPLTRGGQFTAKNLVIACDTCHSSKKDQTQEEFEAYKLIYT